MAQPDCGSRVAGHHAGNKAKLVERRRAEKHEDTGDFREQRKAVARTDQGREIPEQALGHDDSGEDEAGHQEGSALTEAAAEGRRPGQAAGFPGQCAEQWHSDKDLLRSDKRNPCFGRLPEVGGLILGSVQISGGGSPEPFGPWLL